MRVLVRVLALIALGAVMMSGASPAQVTPTLFPENVRSPFGISGGIGDIPEPLQPSYTLDRFLTVVREDAQRATALGARWYRIPSTQYGNFTMSAVQANTIPYALQDALVRGIQTQLLQILPVIGPRPSSLSCRDVPQYLPSDLEAYARYVRQLVERYDMDGTGDMLHMRYPVRYWQIDSDVDTRWWACEKRFATPQEYFTVLKTSYEAIKAADPHAKVLLGLGLFGSRPEGVQYLRELLALGAANFFDIAAYQDFTYDIENFVGHIMLLRTLTRKPVWVTAVSVPSDPRANLNFNLTIHARMLFKYYVRGIAEVGAEKIFWASLDQAPAQPDSAAWRAVGSNGLYTCENIQNIGGTLVCGAYGLTPAARTYRLAARWLSSFIAATSVSDIRTIPPFAPVKLYRFLFQAAPLVIFITWSESGTAALFLDGSEAHILALRIIEKPEETDPVVSLENSRFIEVGPTPMLLFLSKSE
ncbi:MAG: hypothetical protein N3E42_01990 [Candidatus Bipolaricaulota bacterium]|nr:hypothetical protein [Candidatus Bipolaricaulota bacterium]